MARPKTEVRFVYCPRCRQLLTEYSDIPVYKCGGCGVVLKAKNHVDGRERVAYDKLDDNKPVQTNEKVHSSEENISVSSSSQEILSSKDARVSDMDCEREHTESIGTSSNIISSAEKKKDHLLERNPSLWENEEKDSYKDSKSIGSNKHSVLCSTTKYISDVDQKKGQIESSCYDKNLLDCRRNSSAISSTDESHCHGKDSSGTGENREESDGNERTDFDSKGPTHNSEKSLAFMVHNQTVQTIKHKIENSLNEKLESHGHCHYDHVRSRSKESLDNHIVKEDMVDGKIVYAPGDFSKSRTSRSSCAYDGSGCSDCDDCNDDILSQHLHLPGSAPVKPKMVPQSFGNKMSNCSEVRKLPSASLNENNGSGITGSINWNQNEHGSFQESENFTSIWNWMESGREDPSRSPSKEPCYRRDSTNAYHHQSGISLNYRCKENVHNPNSYASEKLRLSEFDRLEILRKVEELREKLSRPYGESGKERVLCPIKGTQEERRCPLYYNNDSEQETMQSYSADSSWHSPGAFNQWKNDSQKLRSSEMYFSGPAPNYRHHVDTSCFHCHPPDWQHPVKFPPCICYNKGLCGACPGYICYYSQNPSPASSSQFRGYSQLQEQIFVHNEDKLHDKEKHQPTKRHFMRPIAGGAPFVVCYSCKVLLQLPADFLMLRRRHHKLQCGACSEVLRFSLHGQTRVLPYNGPSRVQHLPSEVVNISGTAVTNLSSTSQGDLVSYSDDCGLSVCRSSSTEGEPVLLGPPFPISQSTALEKRYASSRSQEPMQMKKTISKYSVDESEKTRQVLRSVIPFPDVVESVKSPLDKNVEAPGRSSPLHRLMGYSSPSKMINRSRVGSDISESSDLKIMENSYASSEEKGVGSPMLKDLEHMTLQSCTGRSEEGVLSEGLGNTRDSTFPRTIKKVQDLNDDGLGNRKGEVSVNGRTVPDHLVKKAEKQAGPIQPGNYWYDSVAGFWGVMGQPCLGILPPFIDEFNYTMTKDCGGGNTGILVNGRELHQDDLDMLSYRGLPTTKNKAYVVKFCGQVIDDDTGEELDSLGKLAPTVEKLGQGFGMHILCSASSE